MSLKKLCDVYLEIGKIAWQPSWQLTNKDLDRNRQHSNYELLKLEQVS